MIDKTAYLISLSDLMAGNQSPPNQIFSSHPFDNMQALPVKTPALRALLKVGEPMPTEAQLNANRENSQESTAHLLPLNRRLGAKWVRSVGRKQFRFLRVGPPNWV